MSTARDKIGGQHVSGEGSLFDVPPAAIGRFRVLHQVGAGTSGPVFRAVHPETNAPLAIKLFTLPFTPERVSSVVRELESLVGLMPATAGACELVDAGLHGSTPYLVTAFAPGDSLDVALKQFGPAALSDLVPRLRTLAVALDAAADLDIHHGALHPRDVLVSDSSTRLTGLGAWPILARYGERVPMRRPYRAPELTDTAVSAAGDRFAMAALAYEWMTGRRAPSAFVAGDMAPLPGVDADALGRVFARALNADPGGRYPTCEALVDELAAVDVDEIASAPAVVARPEARPRRRSARAAAGAAERLPLDMFPTERPADARLMPAEAEAGEDADEDEVPTVVDDGEPGLVEPEALVDEPLLPPVAAMPLGEPTSVAAPPGLLRQTSDSPGDVASSGWGRAALGLLLGLVLGVATGYLVWGRGATASVPLDDVNRAAAARQAPPAPERAEAPAASVTPPAPQGQPPAEAPPAPPATAAPGPKALPVPATPAGSLLVRSTPAGATVFVDDERRGVTPLALQEMELGTRRVRIQRDGFTTEERQVTLTRSRPSRSVDVRLARAQAPSQRPAPQPAAPAARTGTLVIESRPSGAAIVLNGRRVGATPLTLDDVEPGTYTVQLQLPTYRPITTTVRVVAGARARAAASLERAQEPQ
jgi:hypothetical protein